MKDYKLTRDSLEKNLPYAKGLEKDLLEADTALKENKIARKTLRKLKWENLINLLFLIFGAGITFFFTNIIGSDYRKESSQEISFLKNEIMQLKHDSEIRILKQKTEFIKFQKQLELLKKQEVSENK